MVAILVALTPLLCGCRTLTFYSQAIRGQYQIVARQEPIQELLEDPKTPARLKERLAFVLEARRFAEENLNLPANGHYLRYADLGRRFAVWNVFAAPEFSLTAKSWWYPLLGRLDYRGFFSEKHARGEAVRLQEKGYDVYVGGVVAYSTLGWFKDPVLNTFVYQDDIELAELIFHELAHQELFVAGDTDFNEAFATAVAEEGMRRWLKARGQDGLLTEYLDQAQRAEQFALLLETARQKLETIYGATQGIQSGKERDEAILREQKQAVFDRLRKDYGHLKESWGGNTDYDAWFARPLNNAQLNTVKTYHRFVPAFRQLLQQENGELKRFYEKARQIGEWKEEKRHQYLKGLLPKRPVERQPIPGQG